MIGNSIEEALLKQIDHPAHRSSSRVAVLVGVIVALLSVVALSSVANMTIGLIFGIAIGIATIVALTTLFGKREKQTLAQKLQAKRDSSEAEQARKIAEMKRNGYWDKKDKP